MRKSEKEEGEKRNEIIVDFGMIRLLAPNRDADT
jgi:hypothetical protein